MKFIAGFILGAIVCFAVLAVYACCKASGDYARRVERWADEE